jgi:outer membrane biogenesis lipoprotein LolB
MKRALAMTAALASAVLLLAACGEKPQTNAQGVKHDAAPWSGTSTGTQENAGTGTVFTAAGWKVGDKNAWQQQLKTRTQNGQNDYVRDN